MSVCTFSQFLSSSFLTCEKNPHTRRTGSKFTSHHRGLPLLLSACSTTSDSEKTATCCQQAGLVCATRRDRWVRVKLLNVLRPGLLHATGLRTTLQNVLLQRGMLSPLGLLLAKVYIYIGPEISSSYFTGGRVLPVPRSLLSPELLSRANGCLQVRITLSVESFKNGH